MEFYSSYQVRIDGNPNITTRIANSNRLLVSFLDKLKAHISDLKLRNQREKTKKPLVVGLDAACYPSYSSTKAPILQLCFDTHCVIIQLFHLETSTIRSYLNEFFADQDIVFVGIGIRDKLAKLESSYKLQCSKNVIELGSLADRVCRKLNLYKSKLEELASEIVGLEIKNPNSVHPTDWWLRDLTSEQIEYATLIAYASYAVGNKLLAGGGNH